MHVPFTKELVEVEKSGLRRPVMVGNRTERALPEDRPRGDRHKLVFKKIRGEMQGQGAFTCKCHPSSGHGSGT